MLTKVRLPTVLREERAYRLLFGSQLLSVLGDRVTMVALPFAVLATGGGVGDVALVSTAQFLPFVLLALPAGVWADRLDRKSILVVSDLVRLVCQLTTAVLLLTGTAHVAHLALLAALYGAADAFFAPAFSGLLPTTVSTAHVQAANALRGLTSSAALIVGPALAGVLIAIGGGPGGALLFDAVSFAVSVVLLVPVRPRAVAAIAEEDPAATTDHFWTSLREGWSEVRSRPWVLAFLGGFAGYHVLVLPAIFVIGPVLMAQELDGARSWAIITTGFGIGAVLGDVLFLRWRPPHALRVASVLLVGASCQAAVIGSGLGTWPIAGLEALTGVCVTGAFTLWETSLGEHIPARSLSRVSSYDYLSTTGTIPLGNVLAGAVSAAIGLHATLAGMTVLGIAAALAVVAVPAVRSLPRATAQSTER